MRGVLIGGVTVSFGLLLAGFGAQLDQLVLAALLVCAGAMAVAFLERPDCRASTLVPALCLLLAGLAQLPNMTDSRVFVVAGANGDWIVPAGESAYRSFAACVYALCASAWVASYGTEAVAARPDRERAPSGWAGAPVRLAALLAVLPGLLLGAAPLLSETLPIPEVPQSAADIAEAVAVAGLVCCCASSRRTAGAGVLLLLALCSAAGAPRLFASRAVPVAILSLLLPARSEGRGGLLWPALTGLLLAAALFCPEGEDALYLYGRRLGQALRETFAGATAVPEWALLLFARLGYPGLCAAGAVTGAICFLLGRLLRDSFIYAAPAMGALLAGCRVLLGGTAAVPSATRLVAFAAVFGLCLLVGCVRRAGGRGPGGKGRGRPRRA